MAITNHLRVKMVHNHGKYSGVPSSLFKNKEVSLFYIKDKVCKALQVWKGHLFSKDGKEMLIKPVA